MFRFPSQLPNTIGALKLHIGATSQSGERYSQYYAADTRHAPLRAIEAPLHCISLAQVVAIPTALNELTSKYNIEPSRLEKGFRLFSEGKAEHRESLDAWICVSQDGGDVYAVDLDLGLCSCDDAANRRLLCKHYIACWLTHRVNSLAETLQETFKTLGRSNRKAS